MTEILAIITRVAMIGFLIAGMLELGLSLSFRQVIEPLRKGRLVLMALLLNFIIVPLLALGIARGLRLESPYAIGLLLVGLAPGAPFIPKLVQLAKGDLVFATALMVLLMAGTVLYLPWVLPLAISGVGVDAWTIAKPLVFLMLTPLLVGLVIHSWARTLPRWLVPFLGSAASFCGVVVVLLIIGLNFQSVISVFGTGSVLAGILFAGLSTLAGWVLIRGERTTRIAAGLGTGSRNLAAALVVGAQSFKDPKVNAMVATTAIASLVVLLSIARAMAKRAAVVEMGRNLDRPTGDQNRQEGLPKNKMNCELNHH